MNIRTVLGIVAIGVLFAGCSGIKVTADQGETTDYSKYKTYSFLGWQNGSEKLFSPDEKEWMFETHLDSNIGRWAAWLRLK